MQAKAAKVESNSEAVSKIRVQMLTIANIDNKREMTNFFIRRR